MADLSTLLRLEQSDGNKVLTTIGDILKASGGDVSSRTVTSYIFALNDNGSYVRFNNASAITATVPPNASVPFPIGAVITFEQQGAGLLTIAASAGVTVNTQTTLAMAGQWAVACLTKVGVNEWTIAGNLAAS